MHTWFSRSVVEYSEYRSRCIAGITLNSVPSSSETRIEELCDKIRELCRAPHSLESEAELRRLALELRVAINEHAHLASRALGVKRSTITEPD